jgi:hypothetical protein
MTDDAEEDYSKVKEMSKPEKFDMEQEILKTYTSDRTYINRSIRYGFYTALFSYVGYRFNLEYGEKKAEYNRLKGTILHHSMYNRELFRDISYSIAGICTLYASYNLGQYLYPKIFKKKEKSKDLSLLFLPEKNGYQLKLVKSF